MKRLIRFVSTLVFVTLVSCDYDQYNFEKSYYGESMLIAFGDTLTYENRIYVEDNGATIWIASVECDSFIAKGITITPLECVKKVKEHDSSLSLKFYDTLAESDSMQFLVKEVDARIISYEGEFNILMTPVGMPDKELRLIHNGYAIPDE